jgi:hypothetical protein
MPSPHNPELVDLGFNGITFPGRMESILFSLHRVYLFRLYLQNCLHVDTFTTTCQREDAGNDVMMKNCSDREDIA